MRGKGATTAKTGASTPGPGAYSEIPHALRKLSSPAYSIGRARSGAGTGTGTGTGTGGSASPGPGYYSHRGYVGHQAPSHSMAGRPKTAGARIDVARSPGPGSCAALRDLERARTAKCDARRSTPRVLRAARAGACAACIWVWACGGMGMWHVAPACAFADCHMPNTSARITIAVVH